MTDYHLGHVPGTVIVDKTELDALRAENERMRAALKKIAEVGNVHSGWYVQIATDALGAFELACRGDASVP